MAVSGDVIAQDSSNAKLHPYLVALVRWCMSCLWSTATVLLHRLMTAPLQPITAAKPSKSRPAGKEHLDPEPRVECVVLHHPAVHNLDVIFVHGLYGSLGNTWRQGEWRGKYKNGPEKIHLRRPTSIPSNTCNKCTDNGSNKSMLYEFNEANKEENLFNDYVNIDNDDFTNIDEDFIKNMLPTEQVYITEQFYNNTLMSQVEIVDNYEVQAKFVSDLFKNSCDSDCDDENLNSDDKNRNMLDKNENRFNDTGNSFNDKEIRFDDTGNMFNEKESRFNDSGNIFHDNENRFYDSGNMFHDNHSIFNHSGNTFNDGNSFNDAENMIHNEAYECKCNDNDKVDIVINEIDCKCKINEAKSCEIGCGCICDDCYSLCWPKDWIQVDYPDARIISINYTSDPYLWRPLWVKESKRLRLHERAEQMTQQLLDLEVGQRPVVWVGHSKGGLFIKQIFCEAYEAYLNTIPIEEQPKEATEEQNMTEYKMDNEINNLNDNLMQNSQFAAEMYNVNNDEEIINDDGNDFKGNESNDEENPTELGIEENVSVSTGGDEETFSSNSDVDPFPEDKYGVRSRARLWTNSAGFMFYSVPHRGSPLADIKTPLTARSVELIEITKDCSLLLSLQDRWMRAAAPSRPLVRSLVETRRTLMSVLWLRIVSADSADPGIGALCGVSVDHREICKPSSRRCLLYTELAALIRAAMNKCTCE